MNRNQAKMNNKTLTIDDYKQSAKEFCIPVACVLAVAQVESRGEGFLKTGEPTILFERHVFHKLTKGKWSAQHPDISNATPGGYGGISVQHARLQKAAALDRNSALQSASWGKFQIMGFNYRTSGFKSIQGFVNAMYKSERDHLNAFLQFIAENHLDTPLAYKQWAIFAKGYNGPAYYKNGYDDKLAEAYAYWVKKVGKS